jgi:hypothetical protein
VFSEIDADIEFMSAWPVEMRLAKRGDFAIEANPLGRQAIEIWGANRGVAIAATNRWRKVVGADPENVWRAQLINRT